MKVIFCDFDFCLNSRSSFTWHTLTGKRSIASPDRHSVLLLDYLLFTIPDLYIVVSSSWRSIEGPHTTKLYLKDDFGLLQWEKVIDQTPFDPKRFRGREVSKWLKDTKHNIKSYVILDDDRDFFPSQEPFFVNTDEDGFRPKHFDKCCEILGYDNTNMYMEEPLLKFRSFLAEQGYDNG